MGGIAQEFAQRAGVGINSSAIAIGAGGGDADGVEAGLAAVLHPLVALAGVRAMGIIGGGLDGVDRHFPEIGEHGIAALETADAFVRIAAVDHLKP